MHPAWYYDELQQIGVDFEDAAQVEAYDRKQKSNTKSANQQLSQLPTPTPSGTV